MLEMMLRPVAPRRPDRGNGKHEQPEPKDDPDVPSGHAAVHDPRHDGGLQQVAHGFHGEAREGRKEGPEIFPDVGGCKAFAGLCVCHGCIKTTMRDASIPIDQ